MARAQGARALMALAFETTYGTPPASGFTRMPFASTSLGAEQPLLNSELLGYGRDPLAPIKDAVTADGDVVVPLDAEAFGFWLSAVSNSLQLAEKMSGAAYPPSDADSEVPAYKAPKSAAKRTRAAMDTIAADTGVVAGDMLDAGMKAATEIGSAMVDTVVPLRASEEAGQAVAEVATASEALAKPAAMEKPDVVDDLKAIAGVGPKLEKVLNGLGIWTYGQIAEFTGAEIRWLDEELGFRGRIVRDEWLKQAARLTGKA